MSVSRNRRILTALLAATSSFIAGAGVPIFSARSLCFAGDFQDPVASRATQTSKAAVNFSQTASVENEVVNLRSGESESGSETFNARRSDRSDGLTLSSSDVELLLKQLESNSYKQRRDAFLKLCDQSYPIDTWLKSQSSSSSAYRSSIAKWLIEIRKTEGSLSERLEILSAFQKASRGDDSELFIMLLTNRWKQAIEAMDLLPNQIVRSILKDQGELGRFVQLAWRTGNEWAVPQLHRMVTDPSERVAINAWWKSIGMADDWSMPEQNDALSTLARLENEERWEEAVRYAEAHAKDLPLERTLIRAGDWQGWLKHFGNAEVSKTFSAGDLESQQLVAHLMLGQDNEARVVWQKIKERPAAMAAPGMLTLALAMDDQAAVETYLNSQEREARFCVNLFQFGRIKKACEALGLTDFEDKSKVKVWLKDNAQLFLSRRMEMSSSRIEPDPLLALFSLANQIGIPEGQQAIDEACREAIKQSQNSAAAFRVRDILGILVRLNQRERARLLLEELAIEKGYPMTVYGNRELRLQHESIEEPCFAILYSAQLAEPFLIFEYLVRHYDQVDGLDKASAIRQSLLNLEDLNAGRIPGNWEGPEFLRSLTFEIRKRIAELDRDDSAFCMSIARIYEAIGEYNDSISLLQDSLYQTDSLKQLARVLEKAGKPDLAGQLMFQRGIGNSADFHAFLDTSRLLEITGQYAEQELLCMQQLSSVHSVPYRLVSPFFSLIPEELVVSRPESKLMVERWRRLAPENQANVEAAFRYMLSKKDIAESTRARRAAEMEWFSRSADLLRLGDSNVRMVFMNAIPVLALEAINRKDELAVDRWVRMAHRIEPTQIQLIIDLMPWADKTFGREVSDKWFHLYYDSMLQSIDDFPEDAVSLNNTAWLCALCDRNLDKAQEFATRAVAKRDDPTYLDTLAEVEFRLGNLEKAFEITCQCQAREPRDEQHIQQMKRFAKALATKND